MAHATPTPGDSLAEHGEAEAVVTEPKRRQLILVAMCTALVAVIASVSGLNVAQQQLASDLGATQSQLLWVINGYTVALAALLLAIGAIGDRWGRRHVLSGGLVLFSVANIAAAASSSPTMLIIARIAAGAAAAMIMPVTLSVITSSFPAEERGRAVGVWAGFAGAGGILGLVGSAVLVDNFTWPWLFAGPTVLAIAALAMTLKFVPNSKDHITARFDLGGSIFSVLAVGGIVLGIHQGPEVGWSDPTTIAGMVIGVVAAIAFVRWELRQEVPLLDLTVFRNRMLAAGSLGLMITFAVMSALFLVIVQFLQAVLGFSAVRGAVSLLPMAAMMMPLSTISPKLADRYGVRALLTAGSLFVGGGLVQMALFGSVDGGYLSVLPGLLLVGIGMGLSMTPGTTAITSSLPEDKQGVASALNDTVREVGGALGIALLGSVLNSGYQSNVAGATNGLPVEAANAVKEGIGGAYTVVGSLGDRGPRVLLAAKDAFVHGWVLSLWVGAAMAIVGAVIVYAWAPRHVPAVPPALLDDEPGDRDNDFVLEGAVD
ncbi:MAG: putative drug resistance transporter [Ilumatobacteraceae bacterium]|nr:putative drug resistance transporter [Ilumatobacteraceae bacterium]